MKIIIECELGVAVKVGGGLIKLVIVYAGIVGKSFSIINFFGTGSSNLYYPLDIQKIVINKKEYVVQEITAEKLVLAEV